MFQSDSFEDDSAPADTIEQPPEKRVHGLSLLRFNSNNNNANRFGGSQPSSPYAKMPSPEKRVHSLSLLRLSNKLNAAHSLMSPFAEGQGARGKRVHGLSRLRLGSKLSGYSPSFLRAPEKRVHGLSLLRFNNKFSNNQPMSAFAENLDLPTADKRVHGLSLLRLNNRFSGQQLPSPDKRVHGLSLLRYNSKLSSSSPAISFAEGSRDKRIHNLSLLRFSGKSPLGLIRHPKLSNSLVEDEGERSKRMHHLSLLRDGKLFHNQAAESADQQKRFDVVDRLRWQQFLQLQAKRLQN